MRRKLNMEKIRFAVEISNSSVEKLWELLLGDGFFEFLPSFKKRVDTEDGFTIVLKHHKFSVAFDDLVPYSVVSGKVSEYPYHIEFRFTITPREATEYVEFTAWLTGFAEKVPLCRKVFADRFDEYVERLLSQLSKYENRRPFGS